MRCGFYAWFSAFSPSKLDFFRGCSVLRQWFPDTNVPLRAARCSSTHDETIRGCSSEDKVGTRKNDGKRTFQGKDANWKVDVRLDCHKCGKQE